MLPLRHVLRPAVLSAFVALGACGNLPGETLGMYAVKGTLETNTCGPDIGAPNPWQFDILLSQTGTTLYWSWEDGSPLLSGPLSGDRATITGHQVQNVDTRDGGIMGPCDLERDDDLMLTFASGTPPPSFGGTVSYAFSVQEGSTCTDQLSSKGGMYSQLPCRLSYSVTASHE
jgi:hypothetical protein